jgi:short-subunit dehydrogenase
MAYALITGASKGIGRSIAQQLAQQKHDLILVARSADLLATLADSLATAHGVEVHGYVADLSESTAADDLAAWVHSNDFPIGILVNNAGYGMWGLFGKLALEDQQNMLDLNLNSLVRLTHLLLPRLRVQPRAYILNVSSTTAYQAVPGMSVYAASKAFVLAFSRGLAYELRGTTISVTCLSPGATESNFMERAKMQALEKTASKVMMRSDDVARIALKAMFKGQVEVIPGAMNSVSVLLIRLLPKALIERIAWNIYRID